MSPGTSQPSQWGNIQGSEIPSVALSSSFRSFLIRQAGCSVDDAYANRQERTCPRNGSWESAICAPMLGMINPMEETHRKEKGLPALTPLTPNATSQLQ
jgi:hypothetical protein